MVVGPVDAGRIDVGVALAAVKEGRIDDVGGDAGGIETAPVERDDGGTEGRPEGDDGSGIAQAIENCRMSRQQQADVDLPGGECRRQRRNHIGEAAGLDQRIDLGGKVKDAHSFPVAYACSSRSSICRVISVTPFSVRRKRRASSSGSSPTTRPSGIVQP